MSNEIQSISQSNYVLHNIDAKKLYVQEPLFTANSGDAVYVGWRPDETVLFEIDKASAPSEFTVSEPMKNFDRVGFYAIGYGSTPIYYESPAPTGNENVSIIFNYYCQINDNNPYQIRMSRYGTTNGTDYTWIDGKFIYYSMPGLTAAGGTTGHKGPLYKIVGINRKENA